MTLSKSEPGITRLANRLQTIYAGEGLSSVVRKGVDKLFVYSATPLVRTLRQGRRFEFQGKSYPYFFDSYNATWRNERGVEIALATAFLEASKPDRTLELGNVMAYYRHFEHEVVDKYERSPGVLNIDFLEYEAPSPFDTIISISTIEHIGWDEPQRDPPKALRAIEKLKSCLRPGGRHFITFPLGHNAFLDECLAAGRIDLPNIGFLRRVSASNEWVEATLGEVIGAKYDSPYQAANAICVSMSN